MNKANTILTQARHLFNEFDNWADLSNSLFDPIEGLIAKLWPDAVERAAFRKTAAYQELHDLVTKKIEQTGLVEGCTPKRKIGLLRIGTGDDVPCTTPKRATPKRARVHS